MSKLRIMKPNSSNDILWNRSGGGRQRPVEREQPMDSSQVQIFVIFTILFEMLQPIIIHKRIAKYNILSSSQGLKVKTEESHLRSRLQLKSKQRVLGFLIETLSDDYFVWKKKNSNHLHFFSYIFKTGVVVLVVITLFFYLLFVLDDHWSLI